MSVVRVSRAIEPNPGLVQECAKKLSAMYRRFSLELRKAALEAFRKARAQGLVQDSAPSAYEKYLYEKIARAKIKLGLEARKVSYWYCRKMLFHITGIQRRQLERAGVSKALIRQNWKIPVIRGQYMSPSTVKGLDAQIKWMTELITRMSDSTCKRLQKTIKAGVANGSSLSQLTQTLRGMENMDDARAKRVALDQSCKLTQFVQMSNAKDLGIKDAIWIHVPGQFSFRPTHKAMDKKPFNLDKGMWDDEAQAYVHPGELPFCRCVFRTVIPDELLENPKHAN